MKVIIVVFEYGIEIQAVIKYHDFRYPSQIVNSCFPYVFHLDTMSWQAPDFYKKHGYSVIGILPDIPSGNQKYLLMKALQD